MGVWDDLAKPETHVRLLTHPKQPAVRNAIIGLIHELREVKDLNDLRVVQEHLLERLVAAEREYGGSGQRETPKLPWNPPAWCSKNSYGARPIPRSSHTTTQGDGIEVLVMKIATRIDSHWTEARVAHSAAEA